MPGLDDIGKVQSCQDESQDQHGGLRDDQQRSAGDPVSDPAAEQGKQQGRHSRHETDQPQIVRGAGDLVDQIPLGCGLHPGAHQGNHLAYEPQPVIVMFERRKGFAPMQIKGDLMRRINISQYIIPNAVQTQVKGSCLEER